MSRTDFFLSHHQADAGPQASLLAASLRQCGFRVFLDVDTHEAGDIASISKKGLSSARAVLLFIGKDFVTRLGNERDWVAFELRHARSLGKPVVPILLDGFELGASQLPEEFVWITSQRGYRWDRARLPALVEEVRSALNLRTPSVARRSPGWSLAVITLLLLLAISLWTILDAATTIRSLIDQAKVEHSTLAACQTSLNSASLLAKKCAQSPSEQASAPK